MSLKVADEDQGIGKKMYKDYLGRPILTDDEQVERYEKFHNLNILAPKRLPTAEYSTSPSRKHCPKCFLPPHLCQHKKPMHKKKKTSGGKKRRTRRRTKRKRKKKRRRKTKRKRRKR